MKAVLLWVLYVPLVIIEINVCWSRDIPSDKDSTGNALNSGNVSTVPTENVSHRFKIVNSKALLNNLIKDSMFGGPFVGNQTKRAEEFKGGEKSDSQGAKCEDEEDYEDSDNDDECEDHEAFSGCFIGGNQWGCKCGCPICRGSNCCGGCCSCYGCNEQGCGSSGCHFGNNRNCTCPTCGAPIINGQKTCNCGGSTCPSCGAPIINGQRTCNCGCNHCNEHFLGPPIFKIPFRIPILPTYPYLFCNNYCYCPNYCPTWNQFINVQANNTNLNETRTVTPTSKTTTIKPSTKEVTEENDEIYITKIIRIKAKDNKSLNSNLKSFRQDALKSKTNKTTPKRVKIRANKNPKSSKQVKDLFSNYTKQKSKSRPKQDVELEYY